MSDTMPCPYCPTLEKRVNELDARVKELEQAFFTRADIKMPPSCPIKFGPVLNDAKPTPTDQELIDKYYRHFMKWKSNPVRGKLDDILHQLIAEVKKGD
jgi:hypothetical protein